MAMVILLSRRVRNGGQEKDEESTQSCHRKGPMQTHCEEKVWRCGSQGLVVLSTVQKPARRGLARQGRRGGRCKGQ